MSIPEDSPPVEALPSKDDLPEWEPLTPELVEDEAIRGDLMLRWSVILLALLMGWTIIQQTSVLTHVRSGQALAAAGFIPSGKDPLASTTGGVHWVNLSWMWDVLAAGVYGVAGESGLSLLQAFIAVATFWLLSRITLPDLPTWWGSVCAALALLAAFPSLTATPAIVTLLGMTCLMLLLHRDRTGSLSRSAWPIVALLIIWNQFDDRAWIGLAVLAVFALGHWWETRTESIKDRDAGGASLLKVTTLSALAMLLHPFLWKSLLSPVALYEDEYPALRAYVQSDVPFLFERFPAWSNGFWNLSYFNGAGLLLWLVTLVTLVLNARRVRYSHFAVFVLTSVLASCGGRELAVAGIVNAVLATLNAQEWYRASFRQTYSIETAELAFSRGGRAITVIAFFGLAFAMVSGHLTGADGRRVGMGFDPQLRLTIASYRDVLAESFDDRPFNFRPDQGDILVWIGQKPFIDSRLRLFAAGEPSIVDEHLAVRNTLRTPADETALAANRLVWQSAFDRYTITHVVPRLSGDSPDYQTFGDLMRSLDWTLTSLGAATAAFYRNDVDQSDLSAFRETHQFGSLAKRQLESRSPDLVVSGHRLTWPRSPSLYERFAYLPNPLTPNSLQLARHYLSLPLDSTKDKMAALYAAVRHVHAGLAESPDNGAAYHLLGQAYETLWYMERGVMQSRGLGYPGSLRYLQTLAAYHHALKCQPGDALAHHHLFRLYAEQQRQDLALRHLEEVQKLTGQLTLLPESHPDFTSEQQRAALYQDEATANVAEVRQQRDDDLAAGRDRVLVAQSLLQSGFPLTALETLENELTVLSGNPAAAELYARLLLESGRTSEAYDQLEGLRGIADDGRLPEWSTFTAIGEVTFEELRSALSTLEEEHERLARSMAVLFLQASPLQTTGPTDGTSEVDPLLPVMHQTQIATVYFEQILPRLEANEFRRALLHLELGENGAAAEQFLSLLVRNPGSSLRPVVEQYLTLLGEQQAVPPLPQAESDALLVPELADDAEAIGVDSNNDETPQSGEANPDAPPDETKKTPGNSPGTTE